MPPANHLSPESLRAYDAGRLPWSQLAAVESHLDECTVCQAQVAAIDREKDSFVALLREPPLDLNGCDTSLISLIARAQKIPKPDRHVPPGGRARTVPVRVAGFEVKYELAAGGLGVVYLVHHPGVSRDQAVKLLLPEHRSHTDLLARFQREQRAIARMQDKQHVVEIFDAGNDPAEGPYLVMEYLDGQSLNQLVARHGPLPPAVACELVRQAALGLEAAHTQNLVHRDIKPSNLMLARLGKDRAALKVIDFGLVKEVGGPQEPIAGVTESGVLLGTPDYMSPEQGYLRGTKPISTASDVYSLGCTLYELLTGRPPFHDRRTLLAKLEAHASAEFPQPIVTNPYLEVLTLMNAMIDRNPVNRPVARKVAERLAPFGCDAALLRAFLEATPSQPTPPPSRPSPETPRRSRRLLWVAMMAVLIGVVGLVTMFAVGLFAEPEQDIQVKTPQGTLRLHFPQGLPKTAVVLVDGSRVSLKGIDENKGEVVIDVGDHTVEVRDGKEVFRKDKVQIASGKGTFLEVSLDRGTAVVKNDKKGPAEVDDGPVGEIANMSGFAHVPFSVRFSPTRLFALTSEPRPPASVNPSLRIWDLQKRKQFTSWGADYYFNAIFAPGGRKVASVRSGHVDFSDPATPKTVDSLKLVGENNPNWSTDVAFSANGKLLLTSAFASGAVRLWEYPSKKLHREFKHGGSAATACFAADNNFILSGGDDHAVRLWNIENNGQEKTYEGHEKPLLFVRSLADGKRFVSVCSDGKVIVWDLNSGKQLQTMALEKIGKSVFLTPALAIATEGRRLLVGHQDSSLTCWDLDKGEQVGNLKGHKQGAVVAVDITPDGRYALSAGEDRTLRYWRLPPVPPGENKRLQIPVEKQK